MTELIQNIIISSNKFIMDKSNLKQEECQAGVIERWVWTAAYVQGTHEPHGTAHAQVARPQLLISLHLSPSAVV